MRAKRQGKQTLYFHEGEATLPSLMKTAGYRTAAIGKWHLGFGRTGDPDYNAELKPGPLEVGFDSFCGCPRTHNEPPFVFVENHRMVGHDPADPIRIIPIIAPTVHCSARRPMPGRAGIAFRSSHVGPAAYRREERVNDFFAKQMWSRQSAMQRKWLCRLEPQRIV